MRRLLTAAAVVVVLFPTSADAELITWEATGVIRRSVDDMSPGAPLPSEMFPVGSELIWSITFESTRAASTSGPPIFGGPGVYDYPAGDTLDWLAATADWSFVGGNNSVLRVTSTGRMILDTSLTGDIRSTLEPGWQVRGFDVVLDWTSPFSSLGLPTSAPESGRFQIALGFLHPLREAAPASSRVISREFRPFRSLRPCFSR